MCKEDKLSSEANKNHSLVIEISQKIGVEPQKIGIKDVFWNALFPDEKTKASEMYCSSIYGTEQERHSKGDRNKASNKRYFSGPLRTAHFKTTQSNEVHLSAVLMAMPALSKQAQLVLEDFADWVVKKAKTAPLSEDKHAIPLKLKWLLVGHSRGGAIARYLANTKEKVVTFSDGTSVTFEAPLKDGERTITINWPKSNDKAPNPLEWRLEIDILGFSATGGPGLKGEKELTDIAATHLLDFLAVGDKNNSITKPGYGNVMKPYNQRRTINQGSTLFVHIPTEHPAVTKADEKRTLHIEIELLTGYLYVKHLGYPIDADKLKVPVRKKKETILQDVKLSNGQTFSSTSSYIDCIKTIQEKMRQLKDDENYKLPKYFGTNVHGQTDRRFLVMRSEVYKTALEERLASAEFELNYGENKAEALKNLFDEDSSPEVKKYINFTQQCLAKTGLNDPKLQNPKNRDRFIFLKTAAILKDSAFVTKLFGHIDSEFGALRYNPEMPALIKEKILLTLEREPLNIDLPVLKNMAIEIAKQSHQKFFGNNSYHFFKKNPAQQILSTPASKDPTVLKHFVAKKKYEAFDTKVSNLKCSMFPVTSLPEAKSFNSKKNSVLNYNPLKYLNP